MDHGAVEESGAVKENADEAATGNLETSRAKGTWTRK